MLSSFGTILQRVHIQYMFIQNAHGSTLTSPRPDPKGHVRYYHHVALSVVCKYLTLTLERCRRGVYSVPSQRMGTRSRCPGALYNIHMFNFIYIYSFIPMSGCVGMSTVHSFYQRPVMLLRRPASIVFIQKTAERVYTCKMLRQRRYFTIYIIFNDKTATEQCCYNILY